MNKQRLIWLTLLSACCFVCFMIAASLSPLSSTGPNANEYGSPGMWAAVFFVAVLYTVPLALYTLGIGWMKKVMTVLCIGGILTLAVASIVIAGYSFFFVTFSSPMIWTLIFSLMTVFVNAVWLTTAFRPVHLAPS
ncbi:DUF5391 family protein [Bacillus sp. H-16]|uniref:DUF5391 family protein n=1 Tax=Alteribacter salitolerans TaxID=2912333 RepID=UPI001966521A|nr:DUF5391 family protein [Alteribacter salitolerans]MBM7097704.1 DUF5391 family protein [Alteribacter salitolerans]